jgi:hypothetical protein
MLGLDENYKMGRVRKKIQDRRERAFAKVFLSEEGRVFLGVLIELGNLYKPVETPEEEGARRLVLSLREEAVEYGLLDKWRDAEREEEEFRESIKTALKEEDENDSGLTL